MEVHRSSETAPQHHLSLPHPIGPLSQAEEHRLARRWRQHADRRAMQILVRAHLGLVIRIAWEFRNAGPSMADLIQEGNVGLTIAARRFDPSRSTRLATYATYWIRACMMDHVVRTHGPVRIGTTRTQRRIYFGFGKARRRLEQEGRTVTMAELAAELGVDLAELEAMAPRLRGRDLYLDEPHESEEGPPLAYALPCPGPTPEEICDEREEELRQRRLLQQALRKLDPRERDILAARHLTERPVTLQQLGRRFGLSRERVRQLEARAKQRVRELCGEAPARTVRRRRSKRSLDNS